MSLHSHRAGVVQRYYKPGVIRCQSHVLIIPYHIMWPDCYPGTEGFTTRGYVMVNRVVTNPSTLQASHTHNMQAYYSTVTRVSHVQHAQCVTIKLQLQLFSIDITCALMLYYRHAHTCEKYSVDNCSAYRHKMWTIIDTHIYVSSPPVTTV